MGVHAPDFVLERVLAALAGARERLAPAGTLPYLDERLALQAQQGRTRVHRRGQTLLIPGGEDATAALERWYRRAARAEIAKRLDGACAATGKRSGD